MLLFPYSNTNSILLPAHTPCRDTSGNPKMINIGRSIYKDADCLVLVYDITSRESFTALDTFWDSYLAYAQPYEPDEFPVLLVGNKCDLNDRRAVPLEEVCHGLVVGDTILVHVTHPTLYPIKPLSQPIL